MLRVPVAMTIQRIGLACCTGAVLLAIVATKRADAADASTGIRAGSPSADWVGGVCRRLSDHLSSVGLDECADLRLELSNATSALGIPIEMREFPPVATREPRGRVLPFGGIHGDEFSSASVVFSGVDCNDLESDCSADEVTADRGR